MENNLQEGKQLIIEGFEEFLKLYQPYLKIMKGVDMLGIQLYSEDSEKYSGAGSLIEIGLSSFINSLKAAESADEIQQAIESNNQYFHMVFPVKED